MSEGSDGRPVEALPGIERELAALRNALVLLGLKQCSWCRKYVRFGEPGALFDAGQQLICYQCAHDWWSNTGPQLPVKDRPAIEHKLVHWLIYQHHARVIKQAGKAVNTVPEGVHLAANCIECVGAGKDTGGGHCSHCNGLGVIWVVLTEKAQPANM
jgi:hypothetical protein